MKKSSLGKPDLKGKLCVVLGTLVGGSIALYALAVWRGAAHGVEHSLALGLTTAGFVIAGLDATWRLHAPGVEVSTRWNELAFDGSVGGRIEGWPAWAIGALVSALALMLIPSA